MTLLDLFENERQRLFETALDAMQDGIIFMDLEFTIVWINRWLAEQYSSKAPLIGKKCHTVLQNREDPCLECPCIKVFETGKPHTEVFECPYTDSTAGYFEITMFQVNDVNDQMIGAVGHVKDVTRHKHVEELLKDEVTWRRLLVEQSRDGIVVLDKDGKVYEANKQYAHMLGYSAEEVKKLTVWDWDAKFTSEQLHEMISTVDHTGDHFETYHRRKDGTLIEVEISTNGTIYRGQKLIFCVCRDITERKRAEQEREKLIKQLEEALSEIKTLRGILPLCCFCKKVRNDEGYWEQVDVYMNKHLQTDISHSICPECAKKYYPGIDVTED